MAARYIAAAQDGNVDLLREATRKDLNSHDEDGMTATIWAARNGNLEALRLIVGREGDVNKCDYLGLTPLHHAAMRGHLDVVSYLVHWGCNVYALDNDMHSAQELASLHDFHEIIRFLDKVYDQKRYKNPKSVARQKEEAIRASESNLKKYDKLKDAAAKRANKEQKKMEKEISEPASTRSKKNIFHTLTLRMKGSSTSSKSSSVGGKSNFSDMAGLTHSKNAKGVAKQIQRRRNSNAPVPNGNADFRVSVTDNEGNRTLRSIDKGQGIHGTVSEVMYINATKRSTEDDISVYKRPLASDVFNPKPNIYKAKSESDLLDSGVDSYNGDEDDDENMPTLFNRTEFGKLSFLPKNPMINTLQSFEDRLSHSGPDLDPGPEDDYEERLTPTAEDDFRSSAKLPWNPDDVDGLDENDESGATTTQLSALETFLASNGLTTYIHLFSKEEVDFQLLMKMSDKELRELGLPLGPRMKLSEAIHRRNDVLENPPELIDTYL